MNKEYLVKILMIYNNNYDLEFKRLLNNKSKESLQKEIENMDIKRFQKTFFINENILKVYQNLVYKGFLTEDEQSLFDSSIPQFCLIDRHYYGVMINEEVRDFLNGVVPYPERYFLNKIKCQNVISNYSIQEYLEIIKDLNISITKTNNIKIGDIRKFIEITGLDYNEFEIKGLLFVGAKYFQKYKTINLKRFYRFFFNEMRIKDEFQLFKILMPFIKGVKFSYRFTQLHRYMYELFKQIDSCVKVSNMKDFLLFREVFFVFYDWMLEDIQFDDEYYELKTIKKHTNLVVFKMPFDKREEYNFAFLKAYSTLLKVLGFLEVEYKEEELLEINIDYKNLYSAKLSNIGLWYCGYTDNLMLKTSQKSKIKVFKTILAIMFDENDRFLQTKVLNYFSKKGDFYLLDERKILKGINNKDELKQRIKDIKTITDFPKNFKDYFNSLLSKFKEIEKVDYVVLEIDREILEQLKDIQYLFLLAQENKIIIKDYSKFKKETLKLGIYIKD